MIVAPSGRCSSAWPRSTRHAPVVVGRGDQVDLDALLHGLVDTGYRREHQVEHRGEFAVRGGIVDVFPSTSDVPVRIDLWGDEVDRLTAFAVSDQRSSDDLRAVVLFGCRGARAHGRGARRRPSAWWRAGPGAPRCGSGWPRASSSTAWSRGCPSSSPTSAVLPDLLPAGAQVVLVEPRRIRDRAVQLLDEEAALAETLAATWGAKEGEEDPFPRLHVPFDRLLRRRRPAWCRCPRSPRARRPRR